MSENVRKKIFTIIGVCIGMALFLSLISALDWLEFAELHVLRSIMFLQSKYSHKKEMPQDLALIRIDRKSEEMLGALPWSYDILMPLCKILNKSEASAIGLFSQFEQPKKIYGCDNLFIAHHSKGLPRRSRGAVFAYADLYPENGILKAQLLSKDLPASRTLSGQAGRYSLELTLICHHLGMDEDVFGQLDRWIKLKKGFLSGSYLLIRPPDARPLKIPVDEDGQMLINFAARKKRPNMDSFVDVLNADNAIKDGSSTVELQKYNGKIVLIGATDATGIAMANTPFGIMSDFDLHAHAMNTILSRSFIIRLTKKGITAYILAICFSLAAVILWLDRRQIRRRYIMASSFFLCVHALICVIAFMKFSFWLNWLSPAIALALCGIAAKMASSHLELKEAYENLRKTQKQLIQTEKEAERQAIVDRIRRTIFHDVKNGINAMHLLLQNTRRILSEGKGPACSESPAEKRDGSDGYKQAVEKIDRAISLNEKMMPIMGNVLDFFNIKLDKRMDAAVIVRNACKSMEEEIEGTGVSLTIYENGKLPEIDLNEERLFFAFQNLLKNACEAMPKGGNLEVKMGYYSEQNQIKIEISDTGIGIPETELGKIFDWLYTTKKEGQGIGLAITKINIEAHRGKIDVKSKVGEGTTFTVTLTVA